MADLQSWSLIVFRKFARAYAIFEGSDFDIDHAVEQASAGMRRDRFFLGRRDGGPATHSGEAALSRDGRVALVRCRCSSFDVEVEKAAADYTPRHGAIGGFFLAIPTLGETEKTARKICRKAARMSREWDIVVGLSQSAWSIPDLAAELSALEHVRDETPDLQGDRVARSEVLGRIAALQGQLEIELGRAFDSASWYRKHAKARPLFHAEINSLASDLANARFESAPQLQNELLGRTKPSSNAVAARNTLLRRMVLNEGGGSARH